MNGNLVYLDESSTAEYKDTDNIIVDTVMDAMKKYWQNPSSIYATEVKNKINKCRANIAKFINAKPYEIYFTSGSSESNNWAIRGWVDEMLSDSYKMVNVITTPLEHKSLLEAVSNKNLKSCTHICDVDKYGVVDYQSLKFSLWFRENEPSLVSICMANNEIGTTQNIKKISDLVHKHNGVLHVDATQAFGHIPIDVKELGIDMMSVSGHKISPVLKGVGFLYKKNGIEIKPLIYGSQESGLRGGTENTFGIIGLSKAVEMCDVSNEKINKMCEKRNYLINMLETRFGCRLNGHNEYRLPNNVNVTFIQNISGESLLHTLDTSNIKISTGSACNSSSIAPSHVLKAIGLTDVDAMKTVRFSLSDNTTYEDINYCIDEIDKAIKIIEV